MFLVGLLLLNCVILGLLLGTLRVHLFHAVTKLLNGVMLCSSTCVSKNYACEHYVVMVRQHSWSTFRHGCWTFRPTSTFFSVNKVHKLA